MYKVSLMFCLLDLLFRDVLIAIAILVFLKSLLSRINNKSDYTTVLVTTLKISPLSTSWQNYWHTIDHWPLLNRKKRRGNKSKINVVK